MKKLVSLLLTLALLCCSIVPALAETAPTAFSFTLADLQMWIDSVVASLEVSAAWTTAEDGKSATADMGVLGVIGVTMNDEGYVTTLTCDTTVSIDSLATGGYNFGIAIALVTLSAKAAEDISYVMVDSNMTEMETAMNTLVQEVCSNTAAALEGPVSSTAVVAGHPCTISLSIDINTLAINLGYVYQP